MKKWKLNLLLALSVVLAHPALAAVADDHPETKQLIDIVNAQSDPAKLGPYELVANVLINPGKRDQQSGVLRFYRDQDHSRAELQLGAYQETLLKHGNKLYIARSDGPVLRTRDLLSIEHFWRIRMPLNLTLSAIEQKKHDGAPVQCFSAKNDGWKTHYCVDAQHNTVVERSTDYDKTTLAAFVEVGGGRLPTSIIVADPERKVVISDSRISKLVPQEDTFAVPQNSREFETCDYPEGGRLLRRVEPIFPRGTRHRSATLYFRGIVQKDGSFTDIDVSSAEGPEFEKAGMIAAAQWQVSPPTCDGHPISGELEVIVTLDRH